MYQRLLVFESGVNSYEELDIRLMRAKERVVRSTGEEAFRDVGQASSDSHR
jgi:hypothetical protein